MLALLLDVAPGGGGNELLAIIALVIVVISVVTVVGLATGLFIFLRLRQSRAAIAAARNGWAAPRSAPGTAPESESAESAQR